MKSPTLEHLDKAFRRKEKDRAVSSDELQAAIASGLLHDLWDAARGLTLAGVDRTALRRALGITWKGQLTPTSFGPEIKPFGFPNPSAWQLAYDVFDDIDGEFHSARWKIAQPRVTRDSRFNISYLVQSARQNGLNWGQRRLEWVLRSKTRIPEEWKRSTPEDRDEQGGTVYHKEILAPGTLWFHPEYGWHVPALSFTVTDPHDPDPANDDWNIIGISTEQVFIPEKHYILATKAGSPPS